jgi:NTP pyrophosphatase (non-canonical NTP hydrolase)
MVTVDDVHSLAVEKGWWDVERSFGDVISNIHAEISEAWEDYRNGKDVNLIYYEDDKPCGIPIELADAVIRIMDLCGKHGIDLFKCIEIKHNYNKKRSYRHGNKVA